MHIKIGHKLTGLQIIFADFANVIIVLNAVVLERAKGRANGRSCINCIIMQITWVNMSFVVFFVFSLFFCVLFSTFRRYVLVISEKESNTLLCNIKSEWQSKREEKWVSGGKNQFGARKQHKIPLIICINNFGGPERPRTFAYTGRIRHRRHDVIKITTISRPDRRK